MTTIKTHQYQYILDELNRTILAETKAALALLPDKSISDERFSLCRIVVSRQDEYHPRDISVSEVWIDEEDGLLHILGREQPASGSSADLDANIEIEETEWTEDDDLLNIIDFRYLIDQIAEELDDDKSHDVRCPSRIHLSYFAVGEKIAWRSARNNKLRITKITAVELYEDESCEPDVTFHTRYKKRGSEEDFLLTLDDIRSIS